MALKLLKSTSVDWILQLQISIDCVAHKSPMLWESLAIGPGRAQIPFELGKWEPSCVDMQSWFQFCCLSVCFDCKALFPSTVLPFQLSSCLSSWMRMHALEVSHLLQKSLSFFFYFQNIFPHQKWIPHRHLLLAQLVIVTRLSFFKQAKAVWYTRPVVDVE